MKKWHWVVFAILTYIVCLIIYLPATYITNLVQSNSQNKLIFDNVEGTLFSGQASSLSYDGFRINDINWELSPFSLFILRANLDVKAGAIRNTEQIYFDGNIILSLMNPQRFSANDASVFIPAKPVLAQVKLPVNVVASGRFRIDIEALTYKDGCQTLSGNGSWLNAAMNINGKALNLGNFNAVLSCESPAVALQISPDNGIDLDAKILVEQTGKYSALGQFAIPANFPDEVKQGAGFFGEAKGQGKYDLNIKSN